MDFMFEDEVDEVGSDVEAYCPKCKADTTHVVISKYEDEIRRVQCNPCGDVHSFRKPRGDVEDDIPEPIAAKKRALIKKATWEEFFGKHGDKGGKPYNFGEKYDENVIVTHPKFGRGFVSEVLSDSKVEITFKDSRRVLVHNRKDMPGLPLAAEGDGLPSSTKPKAPKAPAAKEAKEPKEPKAPAAKEAKEAKEPKEAKAPPAKEAAKEHAAAKAHGKDAKEHAAKEHAAKEHAAKEHHREPHKEHAAAKDHGKDHKAKAAHKPAATKASAHHGKAAVSPTASSKAERKPAKGAAAPASKAGTRTAKPARAVHEASDKRGAKTGKAAAKAVSKKKK